jgi:hypothetical protein
MRFWLAIRAFFAVLFDSRVASDIERLLGGEAAGQAAQAPASTTAAEKAPKPPVRSPVRNEAVTLLAALQREARFVDIVKEPLGEYSDAQIGAAARDVLRDCGTVLERFFAIRPLANDQEGAEVETPADVDADRFRLAGDVAGQPPYKGRLVHHGWQATRCELPQWSGRDKSAMIVAPVELEIR